MLQKSKRGILSRLLTKVHAEGGVLNTVVSQGASSSEPNYVVGTNKLEHAIRAVYSKEIEFKAMPNMRFFQFATMKTELNVEPGLTISMLTYDNIARGGKLTEGVRMEGKAMSSSMKEIRVTEYGNSITVSELNIRSNFDDVMASATTLLGRDYAIVMDCMLRDVALSNAQTVYADKADGTKVTARKDLDETCKFKVSTVKDCLEILATNNAPKYNGADWICFVHPHQSRDLRDDPAWINASNYGAPNLLFLGEIGKIDDTRFIETTILNNGASAEDDPSYDVTLQKGKDATGQTTGDTNKVAVYQSVLFGDKYVGLAISLPVNLRDNGVIDYGRERGLAWYSIMGAGLLHEKHGVVIETA